MSITGFNKELAVGLSAALLILAFVFPPAVDTSWTQIANARFGMAMLAGVLILSMIRIYRTGNRACCATAFIS